MIAVQNVDDLVPLVQSGALEIYVRGSLLDSLETCDRIVFDLDPGEDVHSPADRRFGARGARAAPGGKA